MSTNSGKLSKNLLRMKFMQRSLDDETKKQLEEEEQRIISDEHWYLDQPELKAKEYESFVGSTERKFVKKRQRAATDEDVNEKVVETNTKRMFLKPQD